MSGITSKDKFLLIQYECDQHVHHLNYALERCKTIFPLDEIKFKNLDEENVASLDQLIFRFTRLKDTLGNKLFTTGLAMLGETVEEMTMLDKLHRLERFSIIENTSDWLELRELRNEFTHEYPDQDQIKAEALNTLQEVSGYLINTYTNFIDFVQTRW